MFDSGFLEILVIAVVALLVVGPERLPSLARKAGHLIGKARAFVNTTKADIEKELQAEELKSMVSRQEQEISELRDMMQDATQTIHKEVEALDANLAEKTNMNLGSSSEEADLLTDMTEAKNVKKDR